MAQTTGKTFVIVADAAARALACALLGGRPIDALASQIAESDYLVLAVGDSDPVGYSAKRVFLMPGWKGNGDREQETAAWEWYAHCVRSRWYDRNPSAHTVISV